MAGSGQKSPTRHWWRRVAEGASNISTSLQWNHEFYNVQWQYVQCIIYNLYCISYNMLMEREWRSPPLFLMEGECQRPPVILMEREWSPPPLFLVEEEWAPTPLILMERECWPPPLFLMEGEWAPTSLILMGKEWSPPPLLFNGRGVRHLLHLSQIEINDFLLWG